MKASTSYSSAARPSRLMGLATWILVGTLAGSSPATAQTKYETYNGFEVDTTPVLPAIEVHPSLYFRAEDVPALRAKKPTPQTPDLSLQWSIIRGDANGFVDDDPAAKSVNDRPRMAKTLAFWWVMEEDEAALAKAIETLLLAYDNVPRTATSKDVEFSGDVDEIYRATWLQNYCEAYDWVQDRLTSAEDSTIRALIAEEAQLLRDHMTTGVRYAPRPHNHRSKPAWALATAALTLSSHPNAAEWLQYALEQANSVTRYQFSSDGIYREGGHYWMYSAVNFIPFLWHYYNVSGVDLFPDYQPAFEWPVKIRMGEGWIPNLEDGYLKPAPTHMVAAAYLNTSTDLNPQSTLGNVFQWHYATTNVFSIDYTGATKDVTWEIEDFILTDLDIDPVAPSYPPTILMQNGQVVFRNRWEGGDGHRYLLFHGVAEADNHNHPDLLSFTLAANDAYLAADAGYGPSGFSDDRRSYYTSARAHNLATVDSYPPYSDLNTNEAPATLSFIDSHFFDFAEKRQSQFGPVLAEQRRAIGFIDNDYFVVADLFSADRDRTYRVYLHGRGAFEQTGNRSSWVSFGGGRWFGESARLDAFFFPSTVDLAVHDGYISLFKDERIEKYVEVTTAGQSVPLLQVLLPGRPNATAPTTEDLSAAGKAAARVTRSDTVDTFVLRPAGDEIQTGDISSDGTLTWVRQLSGTAGQLALREGTTLSVASDVTLSLSVPSTVAVDLSQPGRLDVFTGEQLTTSIDATVRHPAAASVTAVAVDGNLVTFARGTDGALSFKLESISTAAEPDVDLPTTSARLVNYPNPFSTSTEISYSMTTAGLYSIEVYDLLGRRVARLATGYHTAGKFSVRWDGSAGDSSKLSSGLYLIRLVGPDSRNAGVTTAVLLR